MPRIFDGVAGNHPRLNRFDLSYTNTTSMAFGLLYPVQCDEVIPGDVFKMSCYVHAEVMPMVAPIMSDMQMFAHTFFVPYRLLYGVDTEDGLSIWEKYITGGKDGDYDTPLPAWVPTFAKTGFSSRTIWDQIGNPVYRDANDSYKWKPLVPPSRVTGDLVHNTVFQGLDVCVAPKYAYNFIYNNYYRDENLVDEIDITDNEDLLHVAFRKDYFTSALEAQQRGTAPALPVDISFSSVSSQYQIGTLTSSNVSISGAPNFDGAMLYNKGESANLESVGITRDVGESPDLTKLLMTAGPSWSALGSGVSINKGTLSGTLAATSVGSISGSGLPSYLNSSVKATTFTVSDLRLAFAIQRMQELSMRAGYRYTEWLSAHFNAHPTDARLDRPEYIGGCVINVATSPVVQNSGTQSASGTQLTPQGTKSGIGHVDSVQKIGNYRVLEHGLIMTLVSIRPKPIYSQGINRQWLRQSRWDHYMPETAWLSEMAVYNAELFIDGQSGAGHDDDIFGYQAHWNEMRCKNNMVSGAVRDQLNYWTLDRKFASRPHLNQDFIEIDEDDFNKIFAVQDEDPFVVSWSNIIDAYRPLPAMGVPGLIDHVYGGI